MLIEKSLVTSTSPGKMLFLQLQLLEERNKGVKSFLLEALNANDAGGYRSRLLFRCFLWNIEVNG